MQLRIMRLRLSANVAREVPNVKRKIRRPDSRSNAETRRNQTRLSTSKNLSRYLRPHAGSPVWAIHEGSLVPAIMMLRLSCRSCLAAHLHVTCSTLAPAPPTLAPLDQDYECIPGIDGAESIGPIGLRRIRFLRRRRRATPPFTQRSASESSRYTRCGSVT